MVWAENPAKTSFEYFILGATNRGLMENEKKEENHFILNRKENHGITEFLPKYRIFFYRFTFSRSSRQTKNGRIISN